MTPEVLTFLKEYGPAMASVVGTVLAALVGMIIWLGKVSWAQHEEKVDKALKLLEEMPGRHAHIEASAGAEHKKIWESMQGLRAELHLSSKGNEHIKAGLLNLEGVVKVQQETIHQHIVMLAKLDSKLDAVFRFMDAPRRASDTKPQG